MIEEIEGINKLNVIAIARMLNRTDITVGDKALTAIYAYTSMNALELSKLKCRDITKTAIKTERCKYDFTPPKLIRLLINDYIKTIPFKDKPMFEDVQIKEVIQQVIKLTV